VGEFLYFNKKSAILFAIFLPSFVQFRPHSHLPCTYEYAMDLSYRAIHFQPACTSKSFSGSQLLRVPYCRAGGAPCDLPTLAHQATEQTLIFN
jgi:hypothetical protein